MTQPRIAVFAGPAATILHSPPLVTSRIIHDVPGSTSGPRRATTGGEVLRPQRLAAPVTVLVEAFSAHPMEADAASLYAEPDGWIDTAGVLHRERPAHDATGVYVVELRPEDGLYPLPYVARRADGRSWEQAARRQDCSPADFVQTFFPDAARLYQEIDRFGIAGDGRSVGLRQSAEFDFYRAAPSAGWLHGRPGSMAEASRRDEPGTDYFAYDPGHLYREPSIADLARITNVVQGALASGSYAGAQWLEGSPLIEDTLYWLNLLIDTEVPIVGHAAQRSHGSIGADGDRNIVDGVRYILSGAWRRDDGRDGLGSVLIVDEVAFTSREVTKLDARPGGYDAAGGHGGVVGDIGAAGAPRVTFWPNRRHTFCSAVNTSSLPETVRGVAGDLHTGIGQTTVRVTDGAGSLLPEAMPVVTVVKYTHYGTRNVGAGESPDPWQAAEVMARIAANLSSAPLAGFVVEGMSPYGLSDPDTDAAVRVAAMAGLPVVRVGRGNTGGRAYQRDPLAIGGDNLTATKARMLLMAALLGLGALPPAADPFRPTAAEIRATTESLASYQQLFDTH